MKITKPGEAFQFFRTRLGSDVEEFWIAALNSEKNVTASTCLFRGTVDHCLFHPRDVFRFACLHNASSIVVAHNHPSGSALPSPEDIFVTEQLLAVAVLLQIPLVDHLIIAGRRYYSFLEDGKLRVGSTTLA
jgi:DNA repair protein RadC